MEYSSDPGATPSLPARHIAQITRSAELIALQESDERYNLIYQRPQLKPGSNPATYQYWHNYETWPQAKERYSGLHFEGGNLLFVDGHVKWRKYSSLGSGDFGLVLPGTTTSDLWSKTNSTLEYEVYLD